MLLAAITDEISQDFEHSLDVLLEYGATGAELRGLWGTNIADLSEDQVARAKQALHDRGLKVVALSTPFYKCDLQSNAPNEGELAGRMHLATPRGLEEQMDMLNRCIRFAEAFDTRILRVFSFWRKEVLTPDIEARIVDAFEEPLKIAQKAGVTLALENEHACFIGTGAEAARLAGEINSPNFKVVWDPGNAFCAGENPFPDGYLAAKPWIAHVHVKDAKIVDTGEHGLQPRFCVIGEGEIDYVGHFAALKNDGYEGYISLETHFVPTTGSGDQGKGTAEDGSRLCLTALRSMLS